eukprot:2352908-Rhodomonas_salina.1
MPHTRGRRTSTQSPALCRPAGRRHAPYPVDLEHFGDVRCRAFRLIHRQIRLRTRPEPHSLKQCSNIWDRQTGRELDLSSSVQRLGPVRFVLGQPLLCKCPAARVTIGGTSALCLMRESERGADDVCAAQKARSVRQRQESRGQRRKVDASERSVTTASGVAMRDARDLASRFVEVDGSFQLARLLMVLQMAHVPQHLSMPRGPRLGVGREEGREGEGEREREKSEKRKRERERRESEDTQTHTKTETDRQTDRQTQRQGQLAGSRRGLVYLWYGGSAARKKLRADHLIRHLVPHGPSQYQRT